MFKYLFCKHLGRQLGYNCKFGIVGKVTNLVVNREKIGFIRETEAKRLKIGCFLQYEFRNWVFSFPNFYWAAYWV